MKQRRILVLTPYLCSQDLSTRHDWPVKKATDNLPIRLKGNSKRISGNSLSPFGAQKNDFRAALQTLLWSDTRQPEVDFSDT